MKFIVDECTGPSVAKWLETLGHDVFSVFDQTPGIPDEEILAKAHQESFIIITNDKDFGELIYKNHLPHKGVVLIRLVIETPVHKIQVLSRLLEKYADRLTNNFVVVREGGVRII